MAGGWAAAGGRGAPAGEDLGAGGGPGGLAGGGAGGRWREEPGEGSARWAAARGAQGRGQGAGGAGGRSSSLQGAVCGGPRQLGACRGCSGGTWRGGRGGGEVVVVGQAGCRAGLSVADGRVCRVSWVRGRGGLGLGVKIQQKKIK